MEKRQRQARIIAVSLFISLFFLWGGGYNTAPIFLAAPCRATSRPPRRWLTRRLSLPCVKARIG